MGNGSSNTKASIAESGHSYLTPRDARSILGQEKFEAIKSHLECVCENDFVDYTIFEFMLQMKFDRMPKSLCQCLFRGLHADVSGRVSLQDFIIVLALVHAASSESITFQLQSIFVRFLFNVYDLELSGSLERYVTLCVISPQQSTLYTFISTPPWNHHQVKDGENFARSLRRRSQSKRPGEERREAVHQGGTCASRQEAGQGRREPSKPQLQQQQLVRLLQVIRQGVRAYLLPGTKALLNRQQVHALYSL